MGDRMASIVRVQGLGKLKKTLESLPPKVQKKPLRRSLAAGGRVFKKKATANAKALDNPKTPLNQIYKYVSNRFSQLRTNKNAGNPVQRVTIRPIKLKVEDKQLDENGKKKKVPKNYHWVFLEFGTSKMAAKPFMRPAFESGATEATVESAKTLNKELLKVTLK